MIKLDIGNLKQLKSCMRDKKLYCFGAGRNLDDTLTKCNDNSLNKAIVALVDNNEAAWGSKRECLGVEYDVISPDKLCEVANKDDSVILVTNFVNVNDIIEQ